MNVRRLFVFTVSMALFASVAAPTPAQEATGWRAPGLGAEKASDESHTQDAVEQPTVADDSMVRRASGEEPAGSLLQKVKPADHRPITRVTKGSGTLPNDHGQVWREYDISPYTLRVTSTNRPEQAIVDWILRETGYEAWHGEPLGLLSASERTLRVYHTPEMQAVVADIVDRYVGSQAETHAFSLRIVTIKNPNWRSKAMRLMRPVPVQSQGVEGWLLAKENAALLLAELRQRTDFREHSSPHLLVNNGQATIVSAIRPRTYVRGVQPRQDAWPGFESLTGQIDEGYSLQFSPLLSLDGRTVDAVIKLKLCQVEKMRPVMLDVPTSVAPRQRMQVQVPQMTMSNLHERFRWPVDQVLVLSMGVVATPGPTRGNPITAALALPSGPPRADALLFVECKGPVVGGSSSSTSQATRPTGDYTRRY